MKTTKLMTGLSLILLAAFFLMASVVSEVSAREVLQNQNARAGTEEAASETLVIENLASSVAIDVYRVSCTAECIRADVNDTGPFNDTRFKVEVIGSSPNFIGSASATNPAGGISLSAEVCSGSNVNAARRAYVVISEVNNAGAENYDSSMLCRLANANNVAPVFINPVIVKQVDQ